jgi:hypothetical protein
MLAWIARQLFRAGVRSKRRRIDLGEMGKLGRGDPAVWILTQERSRLEYLAAKEEYERSRSRRAYKHFADRLLQLQSTNAIITALINEHTLEHILLHEQADSAATGARRSA